MEGFEGLTHQQRLIELNGLYERGLYGNHPSLYLLSDSWTAGILAILEFVRTGPADQCFRDTLADFKVKWRICQAKDERKRTVLRERGYDFCKAIELLFDAIAHFATVKRECAESNQTVPINHRVPQAQRPRQPPVGNMPPDEIKQEKEEEEQPFFSRNAEDEGESKNEIKEDEDDYFFVDPVQPVEIKEELDDYEVLPDPSSASLSTASTRDEPNRRVVVVRQPANVHPAIGMRSAQPPIPSNSSSKIRPPYQLVPNNTAAPRGKYFPSKMYTIKKPSDVEAKEAKDEPLDEDFPSPSSSTWQILPSQQSLSTQPLGRPQSGPKPNRIYLVSGTGASAQIRQQVISRRPVIKDRHHYRTPPIPSSQLLPRPPPSAKSDAITESIMAVAAASSRMDKQEAHPMLKEIGAQAQAISQQLKQQEEIELWKFKEAARAEYARRLAEEEKKLNEICAPTVHEIIQPQRTGKRPASVEPYQGPEYFDRDEVEVLSRSTPNGGSFLRMLLDSLFQGDEETRMPTYERDPERVAYAKEIFFAVRGEQNSKGWSKLIHQFNDNIIRRRQSSTTWTETKPKLKLIHKKIKTEEEEVS